MNNTTKFLYHITEVGNLEAIRKNGLKCDSEGYIYLFEDKKFIQLFFVYQRGAGGLQPCAAAAA